MLQTIFVETIFSSWLFYDKKNNLFTILCNIINVFTVTFDQFNASLLNKCGNLFLFLYSYYIFFTVIFYLFLSN